MNHPEILLLPILMIADYYLTILGAVLREKAYGKHFVIETYEMNPHYRKDIDSKRLINFRFVGQVLLNTAILFLCSYFLTETREFIYWIVLGFYLTLFGYINGLHLSNILSFLYVKNHPSIFDGRVKIAHKYSLNSSIYSNFIPFVPILFILVFSFSYFVLGSLIAVVYNALLGLIWVLKQNRSDA